MVVDIYGQIVDIGYRDDIESIVLNQSENSSELVVIRKNRNHSLHRVTHTQRVLRELVGISKEMIYRIFLKHMEVKLYTSIHYTTQRN